MGLLPRVQRRLSEKGRQSIRSGSVFVWDEREADMRRWTDGKSWSASRVSGSFLTYREMEGKRGGGFNASRRRSNKTPESGRGSDEDHDNDEPEGSRYKADGLMKHSFSITTSTGQHLHLISYYSRPQHGQPDLPQPTNDPALRHIVLVKGMYPESSMGEMNPPPALTRAPMQQAPYMVPTGPQHGHPVHHQGYAPHYAQPGYGWSPLPSQSQARPYSHYTASPYQPTGQPMPPQHMGSYMPPHLSQHEPRASLPLPPPQKATLPPYQGNSYQQRFPSPPPASEPPRGRGLRAAAQAVMVDQRLNTESARNPRGPLPALNAVAKSLPSPTGELAVKREQSASPPQTSHSNDGPYNAPSRSSILSLLYTHTPPSGEYSCGNTTSAALDQPAVSEDTRALRMLDRSAFRQAAPVHAHG
jgi:Gti1/Pac2 family transcription factor